MPRTSRRSGELSYLEVERIKELENAPMEGLTALEPVKSGESAGQRKRTRQVPDGLRDTKEHRQQ